MGWTRITYSRWTEMLESSKNPREYNGSSPGGVAAELGVSRQSVHKAIERGDLDAWRVERDGTRKLVAIIVKPESVERYRAIRELRDAG